MFFPDVTKEHLANGMDLAFTATLCSDRFGSEAAKDKQLSFAYASHVCDCRSIGQKKINF